jgi:hypothetical protein
METTNGDAFRRSESGSRGRRPSGRVEVAFPIDPHPIAPVLAPRGEAAKTNATTGVVARDFIEYVQPASKSSRSY